MPENLQGNKKERPNRPRELQTGSSEKRVEYKCFYCDSINLGLGIKLFNSKIMLESNAANQFKIFIIGLYLFTLQSYIFNFSFSYSMLKSR